MNSSNSRVITHGFNRVSVGSWYRNKVNAAGFIYRNGCEYREKKYKTLNSFETS
jgi:hypothetical protein